MMVNSRSPSRASPSRRSRVTPGSSSTSASFCPTRRLNSVDLPTLGRPIMAIVKGMDDPCALYGAHVNETENSRLEHDPEKWAPVFPRDKRGTRLRGDHAPT